MNKLFIPYELALKLKELGFDEECLNIWFKKEKRISFNIGFNKNKNSSFSEHSNYISAPLWQQAFDWFREKHSLHCVIDEYENPKSWGYLINNDDLDEVFNFNSYEDARLECLKKLIELCKKN